MNEHGFMVSGMESPTFHNVLALALGVTSGIQTPETSSTLSHSVPASGHRLFQKNEKIKQLMICTHNYSYLNK